VGSLYELFSTPAQYADLATRMQQGGMGWGHAKAELAELINETMREARARYAVLMADKAEIARILNKGGERAGAVGRKKLEEVRYAAGIRGM
jgi:tryptophanyl-tRNA synthetase